jgi:hypothetical protein
VLSSSALGEQVAKRSNPKFDDDFKWDGDPTMGCLFPVKLTAKHLPKLNEVFGDFARGLEAALEVYKKGTHSGRDGAGACLGTVALLLDLFEVFDRNHVTTPINAIVNALAALNENNQLPILTPVPSTGRAKSSYMRSMLEGWAVVTVERVMEAGKPLDKACEIVAKELVKAGVKSTRGKSDISARTVKNWKQRSSEDIAMIGLMAKTRKIFNDFVKDDDDRDGISVEEALEHLSAMLELSLPVNLR